jgi:hypothetical protein
MYEVNPVRRALPSNGMTHAEHLDSVLALIGIYLHPRCKHRGFLTG